MKLTMRKYVKVAMTATLSLAILASTIEPNTAEATTSPFRHDSLDVANKVAKKKALAIQKETKNFTAKQRVKYYNKTIDKIVKDSKKKETKELRILSMFHDVEAILTTSFYFNVKPKNPKTYYHKDPGVHAINTGLADRKGYAHVMDDALKRAGFKTDILSYKDTDMTFYWNAVRLDGKWYHLDAYESDRNDLYKNNDTFLFGKKELLDWFGDYKLKKPYTNSDSKYKGFELLDSSRIIRETKTHYYSFYYEYTLTKVSKTGSGKFIYELPAGYSFAAEKDGWVYGFSHWQECYFFKIRAEDLASEDESRIKFSKVADTHPKKHGKYDLTDTTLTFYDKANKKVVYKLGE